MLRLATNKLKLDSAVQGKEDDEESEKATKASILQTLREQAQVTTLPVADDNTLHISDDDLDETSMPLNSTQAVSKFVGFQSWAPQLMCFLFRFLQDIED